MLRNPVSIIILKATSISKLEMVSNAARIQQLLGRNLLTVVRGQCTASNKVNLDDVLIITNSCSKRIKQLQDKSNDSSLFLRISVQGGGCSGFQYTFDMDRAVTANDDRIFVKDGAQVVVDSSSYELIKGSTVDYAQEMIRSSFAVVNNPQSESACGCGSSFAVKNFSSNPALD